MDLDNIPTSFCCSKPTKSVTEKAIDKLIKSGHAKFFVKYNGACHYILINSTGQVQIFTRRWDDHTIKYPALVQEIQNNEELFPNTLMIVELCIDPLLKLDHMTAQKRMSEIMKANTVKGVCKPDQTKCFERQKNYPVKAAVYAHLFRGSECLWPLPYHDVYEALKQDIQPLSKKQLLFLPQEVSIPSGKAAFDFAKKHKKKLEGFIMWDMRKSLEVTMNGKPLRRASWKIKVDGEMDVIAYAGKEGKKPGQYGSLYIGKLNDEGVMIPMGTVGGLKPKEGETDPSYWTFPCVIEVTYTNIFPDTGALQFGSFSKIHEDKTIEEVDLFSLNQ